MTQHAALHLTPHAPWGVSLWLDWFCSLAECARHGLSHGFLNTWVTFTSISTCLVHIIMLGQKSSHVKSNLFALQSSCLCFRDHTQYMYTIYVRYVCVPPLLFILARDKCRIWIFFTCQMTSLLCLISRELCSQISYKFCRLWNLGPKVILWGYIILS